MQLSALQELLSSSSHAVSLLPRTSGACRLELAIGMPLAAAPTSVPVAAAAGASFGEGTGITWQLGITASRGCVLFVLHMAATGTRQPSFVPTWAARTSAR